MSKNDDLPKVPLLCCTIVFLAVLAAPIWARDTVCAEVKIEIAQELTMERQAFAATLTIENTLADKTIEAINVVVGFRDEDGAIVLASSDPNSATAQFFIRVNNLNGIDNVSGSGSLDGGDAANVSWLIIPAPGASNGIPSGALYFVGATFNYTLEGVDGSIDVAPDLIYVKPAPRLTLDYFLPGDVFADNPLTTDIVEPTEPFTLGVRVQNNGGGLGRNIKIESARPQIIDNAQGLLIDFKLLNSWVQNQPVNNSLLINFGDIPSGEAKTGRWTMQTSLSGYFKDFSAEYAHADDLGGELTSLIENVNTHTLLKDVVVDAAGKDAVKDFLAYALPASADNLQVYESNATNSHVTQRSGSARLSANAATLSFAPTAGFVYVTVPDPFAGGKVIRSVMRSDGKDIRLDNAWFSRSYNRTGKTLSYHLNIFDFNTPGIYHLTYDDLAAIPRPPVLQFIPLQETHEGKPLGFPVAASDPEQTTPALLVNNLPDGAAFSDRGDGSGIFSWTPTIGQKGRYELSVIATDGELSAQRDVTIVVNSHLDTDGDGLPDAWEIEHFGDLNQDALGDTDGDGLSNAMEYARGSDPTVTDGPPAPEIVSPWVDGFVATLEPELVIANSDYTGPFALVYVFEVYADAGYTAFVDGYYSQPEGESGETGWRPHTLEEDKSYFWRARAYDSSTYSPWVNGRFRVNSANALPEAPTLSYPEQGAQVFRDALALSVNNVADPDGDPLYYRFYLYGDAAAQTPLLQSGVIAASTQTQTAWPITAELPEGRFYYWRAAVMDVADRPVQSDIFTFFLAVARTPPAAPVIAFPGSGVRVNTALPELRVVDAVAPDAQAVLAYFIEVSKTADFAADATLRSGWIIDNGNSATFSWKLPRDRQLEEDAHYFWRIKARDAQYLESPWAVDEFRVNAANRPPPVPVINNPGNQSQVITRQPELTVFAVEDSDGDRVSYEFAVYADALFEERIDAQASGQPQVMLPTLEDDRWYYWRARAKDENDSYSQWTTTARFFVNENNIDDVPQFTWLSPLEGTELVEGEAVHLRWSDKDPDSAAKITLYYADNPHGIDRVLIAANLLEDDDFNGDTFLWSSRGLKAGTYYFFATIEDATHVVGVEAESVFTLSVVRFKARSISVASVQGSGGKSQLKYLLDKNYNSKWVHVSWKPAKIVFDLGQAMRLQKIKIAFCALYSYRYNYSLETSSDGNAWTVIRDSKYSSQRFWTKTADFPAHNARYVRLTVNHTELRRSGNGGKIKVPVNAIAEVIFLGGKAFDKE